MFVYRDGGPDHHVSFLSVQLTYICLFLFHDFDYLVAVCTPPYNLWKNPAERVMSELDFVLQAVGMMREKLAAVTLEKVVEGCNSMKDIRTAHPTLQDEFRDSVQPSKILLPSLFQRLKLKDEPFTLFQFLNASEIELFLSTLNQIELNFQYANCTKAAQLTNFPKLKSFLDHCCHTRYYMFSIEKCGATDCTIYKPPYLPREIFDTICHLPDPMKDGEVYRSFSDVYGTATTEKDQPLLVSSAEKGDSGIPFNPSGQFAQNVGKFVDCKECNKPRVLYSSRKLLCKNQEHLDYVLNDTSFSCGTTLKDYITDEVGNEHILNHVFVRKNISCNSQIETLYYASSCFPNICIHCGGTEGLHDTPGYYPSCESCKQDSTKIPILKRKRKLVDFKTTLI